jgi:hypothetical protein
MRVSGLFVTEPGAFQTICLTTLNGEVYILDKRLSKSF